MMRHSFVKNMTARGLTFEWPSRTEFIPVETIHSVVKSLLFGGDEPFIWRPRGAVGVGPRFL